MNRRSIIQLALAGLAGVAVFGLVLVAGPGSANDSGETARTPVSAEPTMEDFVLPDIEGTYVRFSEFASGRPFVVTFGQTTCPPCVMQSHVFKELEAKYGHDVAFLKVYIAESTETAARQVKQLGSPTKTLIDREAKVFRRYGQNAIPVTVIGDAEGRIITIGSFFDEDTLAKLLDKELATAGKAQPDAEKEPATAEKA